MHQPPPPDSRELLAPLLACLPTAFISTRPPPALLPLLSPLLRQKLSYLTNNNGDPRKDGWLPLLSWDAERGAKLPDLVERMHLEPHPVSGEVELDDVRPPKYRRLDEETLQARLEVEQFEILPVYLWCETDEPVVTDEQGTTGPGWKLAELRGLEDMDDGTEWFDSISEANDAAGPSQRLPLPQLPGDRKASFQSDGDSDYWAAYDRTPGRTPAPKQSPAPPSAPQFQPSARHARQASYDYYARYGQEVQPAMDSHDPDEERNMQGIEGGANGTSHLQPQSQQQQQHHQPQADRPISRPNGNSLFPADPSTSTNNNNNTTAFPDFHNAETLTAPRPISPSSSNSSSIEKLEARARAISDTQLSEDAYRAQTAIKQHISTDIKSLFRLARNTGMDREDFERIVRTELECLSMMERED